MLERTGSVVANDKASYQVECCSVLNVEKEFLMVLIMEIELRCASFITLFALDCVAKTMHEKVSLAEV